MALAWIIFQFFMIVTYYTPEEIGIVHEEDGQAEAIKLLGSEDRPLDGGYALLRPKLGVASEPKMNAWGQLRLVFRRYYDEFVNDTIIVCWAMFFVTFFLQTLHETMVAPLMEKFFHFGRLEISVAFAIMAAVGLVVSVAVAVLGKWKVDDRRIALTGLLFVVLSSLGAVVVFPAGDFEQEYLLVYCSSIILVFVIGFSILFISSLSLYSKMVKSHSMGLAMTIKGSIERLGMILGPLWAGGLLEDLYALYGMCLFLCLFVLSVFVLSYKRMIRYWV